jgi:hypothetical protein
MGHSHPDPRDDGPLSIGAALQALPLEAPPRSAWPAVAASMRAPTGARRWRRADRWPFAMATAAALALALLLPVPGTKVGDEGSAASPLAHASDSGGAAATPVDLPTLMGESARLERLIAAVDADPLHPADALVLGLAFEDELAGLDAELAVAAPGSRDAVRLWQQRVDVLSRYAELQSSRRLLASAGQPFETTLVALH